MTKKQALAEFREYVLPMVVREYGRRDRVAVSEAWCNFTDSLCKDRRITRHQDETWTNQF